MCNIAAENSLNDLNKRLTRPVVMGNFRPSIVVKGSPAFDEVKRISLGDSKQFFTFNMLVVYMCFILSGFFMYNRTLFVVEIKQRL